jgi:hypothetical protein
VSAAGQDASIPSVRRTPRSELGGQAVAFKRQPK